MEMIFIYFIILAIQIGILSILIHKHLCDIQDQLNSIQWEILEIAKKRN